MMSFSTIVFVLSPVNSTGCPPDVAPPICDTSVYVPILTLFDESLVSCPIHAVISPVALPPLFK